MELKQNRYVFEVSSQLWVDLFGMVGACVWSVDKYDKLLLKYVDLQDVQKNRKYIYRHTLTCVHINEVIITVLSTNRLLTVKKPNLLSILTNPHLPTTDNSHWVWLSLVQLSQKYQNNLEAVLRLLSTLVLINSPPLITNKSTVTLTKRPAPKILRLSVLYQQHIFKIQI